MKTASFRIQKLSVEGFKAFASPQTLDIGGGHLFVFGRNGHGKSSVVEAIRWCLFGLADRPETEVRNVFYSAGECKVELDLNGPGGIWKVQRRLRPGTGRSDLAIHNPNGVAVPQSQVFPHMARLGPREGTHIIFASQQATNRRPQADITDFDKVLYSYLRVEEIPSLLNRLERVLEEQKEEERLLAKEMTEVEQLLRGELDNVSSHVEEILRNASWPGGGVPTNAETDARIRDFVQECGGALTRSDGGTITREWLLGEADRSIKLFGARTQAELKRDLLLVQGELQALASARAAYSAIEQQLSVAAARVVSAEALLAEAVRDASREELEAELSRLLNREAALSKHVAFVRHATEYYAEFSPAECPACSSVAEPAEVSSRLAAELESDGGAAGLTASLTNVRARLVAVTQAEAESESAKMGMAALQSSSAAAATRLKALLDQPEDLSSYQQTEERIRGRAGEIEIGLAMEGGAISAKQARLKNLQSEARFQEFRSRAEVLTQSLESGLEPTRAGHRDFLELLDTLDGIRETLQDSFNSALNTTLPTVGELMTNVYRRLTQQASFTQIAVQPGPMTSARALRVKVTSDRTPGVFFEPVEVLNGQAFSALNLVPYFVFSQFQADALELDCLLIDDPSQSFDTSRIELLLQELATAASHAQVIVASHEEDRFEPTIPKTFPPSSYRVLRVTNFTPEKGPNFEWKC